MRKKNKPELETKVLDINADMQGTLTFKDPVHLLIRGSFNGYLDAKGVIEIGAEAHVKGDIQGDEVIIAGQVDGNVFAEVSLKVKETGVIHGDLHVKALAVEAGAFIEGACQMKKEAHLKEGKMSIEDVSRYLNVEAANVSEWVSSHQLPAEEVDGHFIIDRSDVDAWIQSQQMVVN